MAPVAIPGVTFTNWPDDYIHSTDDDLWQMDATQVKRNAVAVASAAMVLAGARDEDLGAIAGEAVGRALARIGRDTATAAALARSGSGVELRRRAASLVRESVRREQRALRSLERLSSGTVSGVADAVLKQLPTPEAAVARLEALLQPVAAAMIAPAAELAAERRVPSLVDDVQGFLDKRSAIVRPAGLHPLMAFEVLNFVDGQRSYADVYRAVAAEADAAGEWYYGTVTVEDVAAYLDSAVKAGVATVVDR
jgi:hypothetical protein